MVGLLILETITKNRSQNGGRLRLIQDVLIKLRSMYHCDYYKYYYYCVITAANVT